IVTEPKPETPSVEQQVADIERRRQEDINKNIIAPIFPETQIKTVLYHNTDDQFDKFREIPVAKFFTKSPIGGRKYRLPVILNIRNPKVFAEFIEDDEKTYGLAEMYVKNGEKDGIINGTEGKTRTEYRS